MSPADSCLDGVARTAFAENERVGPADALEAFFACSYPPSEPPFKRRLSAGFTLLELSIVLVIIGLLIGGIFVGQSLIHNAQLNAVITEFTRYQTAVQSFKQQYQALPGDMNNATSFWGVAGGTGSDTTCMNTVSTTAATCNGNGDEVIGTSVVTWDETFRAWQHLATAKMIEGFYAGNPVPVTGGTIPASRYGNNMGLRSIHISRFPAVLL